MTVTQKQWRTILEENELWTSQYGKGDDYPAYNVSYYDIVNGFLPNLNRLTKNNFRLPTEAEWEYAARGGNKSHGCKYSGGNTIGEVAWNWENSRSAIHPVKGKKPNELGLHDMSGDVWEWCLDWMGDYSDTEQANPKGPSNGLNHVVRGGSFWDRYVRCCRVSHRFCNDSIKRFLNFGFRLVLPEGISPEKP